MRYLINEVLWIHRHSPNSTFLIYFVAVISNKICPKKYPRNYPIIKEWSRMILWMQLNSSKVGCRFVVMTLRDERIDVRLADLQSV